MRTSARRVAARARHARDRRRLHRGRAAGRLRASRSPCCSRPSRSTRACRWNWRIARGRGRRRRSCSIWHLRRPPRRRAAAGLAASGAERWTTLAARMDRCSSRPGSCSPRSAASSGASSAARCPASRRRSPWRCCCRSPTAWTRCSAIVLLASTYVGAEYGGSIPAILIRTPGTNAAAATVIDGYEMNQQGRARRGARHLARGRASIGGLFGLALLVAADRAAVAARARCSRRRPISRSASSASASSRR